MWCTPSVNGLVQDCGISSADALEIPQSCNKPSLSSGYASITKNIGHLYNIMYTPIVYTKPVIFKRIIFGLYR